ncbi:MAG: glycosyltransferase family 4 protein [bacterium]
MTQKNGNPTYPSSIALVGNHLPRRCGIATFTSDLLEALSTLSDGTECWAVAMNDMRRGYPYPPQVRFDIHDGDPREYRLAADFLNMQSVDVVCVQHEFGIFGGHHGAYILQLLRNLRTPVVTTLHTVLDNPGPGERAVLAELTRLSDRLVVMSLKAGKILMEVYGVPRGKIVLIPHGIPDIPFMDPSFYKDQFGVEGRKVILTLGLLSPNKGIEYMIEALPQIVARHPEAVYIVLGATHPHVKRAQGESYRQGLQLRAEESGVAAHLMFHDRFVELRELCEFLGCADIYVTPYLNREQIVSGTLAYALGSGKATVSTPYWYAVEMLAEDRGKLVPFRDSGSLAGQIVALLDDEVERAAIRKRAYTYCRRMIWKEVARQYLELFREVRAERSVRPKVTLQTREAEAAASDPPPVHWKHLIRLSDDVGILQHATFAVPARHHGYCTDDNARALIAALMSHRQAPEGPDFVELACRYLSFLLHAFREDTGRFRNFLGYDRRWRETCGSEDSHGRAVWALGIAVELAPSESVDGMALDLFQRALRALPALRSPRAWAFSLLGLRAYLRRFGGDTRARGVRDLLARRLFGLYLHSAAPSWPWIEDVATYANGTIPQALLLSGAGLGRSDMIEAGLRSLEWLLRMQSDPRGHLVPIGNAGWFPRGGRPARFDQQPIEAQSLIEACLEAYGITRDERWILEARRCLDWFLGRNDLNVSLVDFRTGGCCDGLTPDGPNRNRGAESTLAWLLSLLHVRALGASATETVPVETAAAI